MYTLTEPRHAVEHGIWSPGSWRNFPARQQPDWDDPAAVAGVLGDLSGRPGLVRPEEADSLRGALASAARGQAIVLQAGDCAERFADRTEEGVRGTLQVIRRMAWLLGRGAGLPVVTVGRIAGQFGKPRSLPVETVGGVSLPVYRGDTVNDPEPTPAARRPDPRRMRRGYDHARTTLEILSGLGAGAAPSPERRKPLFTSHEALLLPFEEALTRKDPHCDRWHALAAHHLWIGDRTREPDGAHVEFLSGVANPLGVKLGPTAEVDEVLDLCERLDPHREPGRLTLIARMGAGRVVERLMPLVRAVAAEGRAPVWLCDPMHGNTMRSADGYKTRRLTDVVAEIEEFLAVHRLLGTHPGGLHLELAGSDVTECVGGDVTEADLGSRYESACDPRLNAAQSVQLAFRVAEMLGARPAAS